MFKIVLLICFGVATAFPNSFYSEDVPSYRELTCRDYVLDKCTIELDGLLESVKDTTEENCQKYCSMVYEGVCQVPEQAINLITHIDRNNQDDNDSFS